jgi:hypothetical protein
LEQNDHGRRYNSPRRLLGLQANDGDGSASNQGVEGHAALPISNLDDLVEEASASSHTF